MFKLSSEILVPIWERRYILLGTLSIILFFLFALVQPGGDGEMVVDTITTIFVSTNVVIIAGSSFELLFGLAVGVPIVVFSWFGANVSSTAPVIFIHFLWPLLYFFSFVQIVKDLLKDERVTVNHLAGCVVAYFQLGFSFCSLYFLIELIWPFSLVIEGGAEPSYRDMLFLSFQNLTTSGVGRTIPRSPIVSSLSVLEAITGQMFMAVFVGQMVGLFIGSKQNRIDKKE